MAPVVPGAPHSASFPLISFASSFFDVVISSTYFVHSVKLSFGLLLRDSQSKQRILEIQNCCNLHLHYILLLTLILHDWVCFWENCWTSTSSKRNPKASVRNVFARKICCLPHLDIFLNAIPVSVVDTPLADITPAWILMCVKSTRYLSYIYF